jgi:hypothetical protein
LSIGWVDGQGSFVLSLLVLLHLMVINYYLIFQYHERLLSLTEADGSS